MRGYLRSGAAAGGPPVALIAPHAGYVFSGPTAGKAFAALAGAKLTRVILLGPSHQADFSGGALPSPGITAFATPLGEMPVDREAVAALAGRPEFAGPTRAHDREHCLEVELPFLQATVGAVPIVPIIVGAGTDRALALAMARRLAELVGPGTLVVASSDFTHYGAAYGYQPFPADRSLPASWWRSRVRPPGVPRRLTPAASHSRSTRAATRCAARARSWCSSSCSPTPSRAPAPSLT